MTANEKRAQAILDEFVGRPEWDVWSPEAIEHIAAALDAAERRGEDRVLRWWCRNFKGPGWNLSGLYANAYRKDRKARRRARGKA